MKKTRGLTVLAATTALLAGGVIFGGAPASAATCYGGAFDFIKFERERNAPYKADHWYGTSNRCADINIKMTSASAYVKWCWKTGRVSWECSKDGWKYAQKNEWKTIATNVKDGTLIKVQFKDFETRFTGKMAL